MTFDINNVRVLHLESTTVCNAACPQCAREDASLYNDSLHRSELTVEQVKERFDVPFIKKLEKVFMCGDFGDPAANHNTLEILEYFRSINPSVTLGMNTNGSIQNTQWWAKLGQLFSNPLDYCVFSIDGLADTNHIYRINTRFEKIIENAKEFIQNGGKAHWDMLVFAHNEHQVNAARNLAKEIGFTHFRSKVSKRFATKPVVGLEPPASFKLPNVSKPTCVDCFILKEKSVYVAATGELFPCCWLGNYVFNRNKELDSLLENNFEKLFQTMDNSPHAVCLRNCGVKDNSNSSFENQWILNEALI
jgi:sulfatase maturation enzyme AslB (radical SAM superfamily)